MKLRAFIAALAAVPVAHAQWAPQQPQRQTYPQQQPAPGGGYQQPYAPGTPRAGGGRTEAALRDAEHKDAGRGLEWFYAAPELGVTNVGLTSLSNGGLLPGASAQTGTQLGVGLGARLLYFTVGMRGRLAFLPDFKAWSLGPEAAFHIPIGNLEPYALAGLGYTALGGLDDPGKAGIRIRGVHARLGGGADYYLTPSFSVGGLGTAELLFLGRPAVDSPAAGPLASGGSGTGLALSLSLVLGLHLLARQMGRLALVWVATTWAPLIALLVARARRHLRDEWPRLTLAMVFGALAGAIGASVELRVWRSLSLRGLDAHAPVALAVALLFAGPLAEGATLAAAGPSTRRALAHGPFATARAAGATAAGYALADHFVRLWRGASLSWSGHLVTTLTWVMLAASWGYMAGRAGPGAPGRKLFPTWVAAALARGLIAYVLSQGTPLAPLVVAPLTLLLLALGFVAREDRTPRAVLTDAFARRERPISLPYVAVGMLANQGALLASLGLAIVVGNRAGVPFSQIDDLGARATLPLVVLGLAGLAAFPAAGFLVARARSAPTLVEPALSAGLAIVVSLLALGVTSRVAFVLVLATAPVALVLACGGAWLGMGRR